MTDLERNALALMALSIHIENTMPQDLLYQALFSAGFSDGQWALLADQFLHCVALGLAE